MKSANPLAVLGHSVKDKPVRDYLKLHAIAVPKGDAADDDELTLGHDKLGIFVELFEKRHYDAEFDRPSTATAGMIVAGIDLLGAGSNTSRTRKYPHALPFGLAFGEPGDGVIAKLGTKPSEKIAGGGNRYHVGWWFIVDGHKILVALSKKHTLEWIRIKPLDKETATIRRLKATLAAQNKNIDPRSVDALASLGRQRPTLEWKKRMKAGDASFTAQSIIEADPLLDAFVANLIAATTKKSASGVYSAVKKVVLGFNKLNTKYESVVETMEREELADFIRKLVATTGYRLEKNQDITAEWRAW